jgi:hypothetical protein
LLASTGCGVDFTEEEQESEILKALSVSGDFSPSGALVLTVDYEQPYPALVNVSCDVLADTSAKRAERIVSHIMERPLEVNDNGGAVPEATPIAGSIEQEFQAPEQPGNYEVDCFTVGDEDNFIDEPLVIDAAPDAGAAS